MERKGRIPLHLIEKKTFIGFIPRIIHYSYYTTSSYTLQESRNKNSRECRSCSATVL